MLAPPLCNEQSVLRQLRQAYIAKLTLHNLRQNFTPEGVAETGLGAAPPKANQFAPSRNYYNQSRYCQARLHLVVSPPDSAYWRLDGRTDPAGTDYGFDVCFPRYDTLAPGCPDQRPPKQ
jgi:hypothetical protein